MAGIIKTTRNCALLLGTSTAFAEQVALSPMEQKGRAGRAHVCTLPCHRPPGQKARTPLPRHFASSVAVSILTVSWTACGIA